MKKVLRFFTLIPYILMLFYASPALSEDIYKLDLMWPELEQPWYFDYPNGIAVDAFGYVYVSDLRNHRILKFDSKGHFVTKWGSKGSNDGQFNFPSKVALDSLGYVYIIDSYNNRIQKFDSSGQFITKWGSHGDKDGQFLSPSAIAIDPSGNVYVADGRCIHIFDSDGNFLMRWWGWCSHSSCWFYGPTAIAIDFSGNIYVADIYYDYYQSIVKLDSNRTFVMRFGSFGSGDGQFRYPEGIATDSSGNLYVADSFNNRIQTFDSTGNFVGKWHGNDGFSSPSGIAFDGSGHIYVTDSGNNRIQTFDLDGTFITQWDSSGSGYGQFDNPIGIALDPTGNVYVADSGNHRIQTFGADGNSITQWGSYGTGEGQFNHPQSLAIDSSGNVYVADYLNHRIQKFDTNGNFIIKWGSEGSGDGQFQFPNGVAMDPFGNVYVSDSNHVQKFDASGHFIAKWTSIAINDSYYAYYPLCIASDSSGNIYVVARSLYLVPFTYGGGFTVIKLDSNGTFITKWSSIGDADGMAVDLSGYVHVTDSENSLVQKFDSDGNLFTQWGSEGTDPGQFKSPKGIAVDSSGNVYVADTQTHRIQKFSPTGKEVISIPNLPTGPTREPTGLSLTYLTGSSSSDHGHAIEYRFDWGDGTYSDWSSSESASKVWYSPGTYIVKAQARCSVDTRTVSGWSAGLEAHIGLTSIFPRLPVAGARITNASCIPTFSWEAIEPFKRYEIWFLGWGWGITTPLIRKVSGTEFTPSSSTWKKTLLYGTGWYSNGSGWKVVGIRADKTIAQSEWFSFNWLYWGPSNLQISFIGELPMLSWNANWYTKFKVSFGKDRSFTEKTSFGFNIKDSNNNDSKFKRTLKRGQWASIRRLVGDVSGSPIYWYVESWDGLGRYVKTDTMSFLLRD